MTWLHPIVDWIFAQAGVYFAANPIALMVLSLVHKMVDLYLFGAATALTAQGLDAASTVTDIVDSLFTYVEAQLNGHPILATLLKEANAYIDQWLNTNPAPMPAPKP